MRNNAKKDIDLIREEFSKPGRIEITSKYIIVHPDFELVITTYNLLATKSFFIPVFQAGNHIFILN
jgi:hypothetical protein